MKQSTIFDFIDTDSLSDDTKSMDIFDADCATTALGKKKRGEITVGELVESHNGKQLDKYLDDTLAFVSSRI